MGSVTDFLFDGRPPPNVTTTNQSSTNIPSWLSDYTQALIARAGMTASEPYQTYGGSRVADFSPLQRTAHSMAAGNVGSWKGLTDQAQNAYSGIIGGAGALNKASPYLSAGTGSYTEQVGKYMDPYVNNVIDRSTQLAQQKLEEQLMPAIKGNFIKAGAYGSAGQQRATGRALRDVTGEIQSQARAALSDAYQSGADLHGAEAMRQIQAGQIAGGLGSDDLNRQMAAGQNSGALAQMIQQMQGRDMAGLAAAGAEQQGQSQRHLDTAYQDFERQRDYPRQNLDWMSSIIRGVPYSSTTQSTGQGPSAAGYGPSGVSQLASLYSLYEGIFGEEDARGGLVGRNKARGGLMRYSEGGKVGTLSRIAELMFKLRDPDTPEDQKSKISAALLGSRDRLARERGLTREQAEQLGTEEYVKTVLASRRAQKHARGGLATFRRLSNG
jgi:hypothetical protein